MRDTLVCHTSRVEEVKSWGLDYDVKGIDYIDKEIVCVVPHGKEVRVVKESL